jgi:hypothetical protein
LESTTFFAHRFAPLKCLPYTVLVDLTARLDDHVMATGLDREFASAVVEEILD